ncbi:hypothetical protein OSTOST_02575, partial [Ostertagia ostertagi]
MSVLAYQDRLDQLIAGAIILSLPSRAQLKNKYFGECKGLNNFMSMVYVKNSSKSSLGTPEATTLKRNIRLYFQGCLQAGCFMLVSVSFHVISTMFTTKWALFATTTLVWELSHAVDGLILIVFHDRFRVILCRPQLLWQRKKLNKIAHDNQRKAADAMQY